MQQWRALKRVQGLFMGSIFTLGFLVSRSCQADEESDKWVENICVSNAFIVLCQDPVRFFTAQTFQPNILVTRHLDKTHLSASSHETRVNISLKEALSPVHIVGVTIYGW